jgi:hypothetical protein
VAYGLTCHDGQVDQVAVALRALRAAQAGVPRAEQRAKDLVKAARDQEKQAREGLAAAIVAAYQAGARVGELASRAEYNRESIRRILRKAGIEPE